MERRWIWIALLAIGCRYLGYYEAYLSLKDSTEKTCIPVDQFTQTIDDYEKKWSNFWSKYENSSINRFTHLNNQLQTLNSQYPNISVPQCPECPQCPQIPKCPDIPKCPECPTLTPTTENNNANKYAMITMALKDPSKGSIDPKALEISRLCIISHIMYAHHHSYPYFFYHDKKDIDLTKNPVWSKIPLIKKHLPHYEWVMWVDSDAYIVNVQTQLSKFVDDKFDCVMTSDYGGLNIGIFFIKNTPWSYQFLDIVMGMYDQFHTHSHKEQAAMRFWIENNREVATKHIKMVEQKMFNSYGNTYIPGDFILHMPGLEPAHRMEVLRIGGYVNMTQRDYSMPDIVLRMEERLQNTPY